MSGVLRKTVTLVILSSILSLGLMTSVEALEDQFEISLSVTQVDNSSPTTPTGLSTTAVSSSQINLSWTASTDNVAVTAYRVFRDNAFIATSTVTSYSDTGLIAQTTYAYTVSAVDAAFNESARSATSSATTLAAETTPPAGGGSGVSSLQIINLQVVPSLTYATLSWQTNKYSIWSVSWGETRQYELGTSASGFYLLSHALTITELEPGTRYFFRIEVTDGSGRKAYLDSEFQTTGVREGIPNPANFQATARAEDILLSWKNPSITNFDEVRIMRSDKFFSLDPFDGTLVYEGRAEEFVDSGVVPGTLYYYTIFTRTKEGDYSSGSLAEARIPLPGEPPEVPKDIHERIPKAPAVHPAIEALSLLDFDFIQDGKRQKFFEGKTVLVDGTRNLTVSLDYGKVPEVLKTILVTLIDPEDLTKTFSFLLGVNEEKTRYLATIGPLDKTGKYTVKISILDFKNQGLKKIEGTLLVSAATLGEEGRDLLSSLRKVAIENFWNLLILLLLIAIVTEATRKWLEKRKMSERHEENKTNIEYGERN